MAGGLSEDARRLAGLVGLLAAVGILIQYAVVIARIAQEGRGALDALWVILGYFTVLTNALVAVTGLAVWRQGGASRLARPAWLAGVAVWILVVLIVYKVALSELWEPAGMQLVADGILHSIVPAGWVLWWAYKAPKTGLDWGMPLLWVLWPLAYFGYAMLRGAATGVYPYPYIDVGALGWSEVLVNAIRLMGLVLALGLAGVALARHVLPGRA